MSKPECIREEHVSYLNSLPGVTLSEARDLLMRDFNVEPDMTSLVLTYWQESQPGTR